MRFSTFGIVAATFAVGVYGYSSVFSVADNRQAAVGPAGWTTFVDSRHIVQSAPHHLDREPTQEIRAIDAEQAVVFGHSDPVRARPLERRVASLGNSSLAPTLSPSVPHPPKQAILNTLPPLPVRGPARSIAALSWSAFRKVTPEQSVVVVLPERKVLSVAGSGRKPMRAGLPQKVASASRAKPSFDTFTRSSLGGPPPADLPARIVTGSIARPARLLVKKAAPQAPKPQFAKLADDPPRGAATSGKTEAAGYQRRVLRTPRRLASIDAVETPPQPSQPYSNEQLPPARGPQLAATDDTWASESPTINARQHAAARRKAHARRVQHTRRARRLERRTVQRRRADARRLHAGNRRSARRPRHVRRRGGRNYRQFQARRNRTIANQLRLRRRIRGIY